MGAEPRSFMIFDNEQPDSRILIFASDFAIKYILAKSESWFMGGTFKCSSNMFQQLYVGPMTLKIVVDNNIQS